MRVLFVHGMGRTPASGWPLLYKLRRAGYRTSTFAYSARREGFLQISERLAATLRSMLARDELVLIGHSLGGVLLRSALASLRQPVEGVRRLFLVGSPVSASRLALRLTRNPIFRMFTRDCGQLLASSERMASLTPVAVPTTSIAGTRGVTSPRGPFGLEANDGVVSVSEVTATWLRDQAYVPVPHTLLPASGRVAEIILQRLDERET